MNTQISTFLPTRNFPNISETQQNKQMDIKSTEHSQQNSRTSRLNPCERGAKTVARGSLFMRLARRVFIVISFPFASGGLPDASRVFFFFRWHVYVIHVVIERERERAKRKTTGVIFSLLSNLFHTHMKKNTYKYIHTNMHKYIHTYVLTHVYKYIHTYIHACTHASTYIQIVEPFPALITLLA